MTIHNRLSELEAITRRENADYEAGAWMIFEYEDGTYTISSARLGKHTFESESEMDTFIEKHHKGLPPECGVEFILVSFINAQGEPPEEL